MRRIEEELPENRETVVAYCKSGHAYIARYERVLTWKGWKHKFMNITTDGTWHKDVIGWNRIPLAEDTF